MMESGFGTKNLSQKRGLKTEEQGRLTKKSNQGTEPSRPKLTSSINLSKREKGKIPDRHAADRLCTHHIKGKIRSLREPARVVDRGSARQRADFLNGRKNNMDSKLLILYL